VDAEDMTAAVVRGGPRLNIYGGRLCENMIQAMARDVFAEGLLRVDAAGLNPICSPSTTKSSAKWTRSALQTPCPRSFA
jgi:hypothetical protein